MEQIKRRIDSLYKEDTDLPLLYRRRLPLWTRVRRFVNDSIGKLRPARRRS